MNRFYIKQGIIKDVMPEGVFGLDGYLKMEEQRQFELNCPTIKGAFFEIIRLNNYYEMKQFIINGKKVYVYYNKRAIRNIEEVIRELLKPHTKSIINHSEVSIYKSIFNSGIVREEHCNFFC